MMEYMKLHTQKFAHMEVGQQLSLMRESEGVVMAKQCHGNTVRTIVTGQEDTTNCDALITQNKELRIGIYTADCAPIAYSDGATIGVAHVGWRGLCLGLAQKMLPYFDAEKLEVYVGPHLHIFEIQRDACYDTIKDAFGTEFFVEKEGKIFFKYKEAVAACLPKNTFFDSRSTGEDIGLPSHRRGQEERIISVVQFTI